MADATAYRESDDTMALVQLKAAETARPLEEPRVSYEEKLIITRQLSRLPRCDKPCTRRPQMSGCAKGDNDDATSVQPDRGSAPQSGQRRDARGPARGDVAGE